MYLCKFIVLLNVGVTPTEEPEEEEEEEECEEEEEAPIEFNLPAGVSETRSSRT